jgi:hypothetical protein
MADERDRDRDRESDATAPPGGILGLGDAPVSAGPDDEVRGMAPDAIESVDDSARRRRSDDVIEREDELRKEPITGPEPPPGVHVQD